MQSRAGSLIAAQQNGELEPLPWPRRHRSCTTRELVALAQGKESTVGESYEIDLWAAQQLPSEHVALLRGRVQDSDEDRQVMLNQRRTPSSSAGRRQQSRQP